MSNIKDKAIDVILFYFIGFNALIAQIIYIREFLVVFSGNEISLGFILGNWLLWTALGSFISGKIRFYEKGLPLQILLIAFFIPFTVILIRLSKRFIHAVPGEIPGIFEIFLVTFFILAPISFLLGGLFVSCSRRFAGNHNVTITQAVTQVYLWESVGATVGGLLLSLFLFKIVNAIHITLLLSLMNFIIFYYVYIQDSRRFKRIVICASYLLFFLLLYGLHTEINRLLWQPMEFITEEDSPFGKLSLVGTGDNKIIYENGTVLLSSGQEEIAEENVHYALLTHPMPAKVLMIGGGLSGSLLEVLKHPSVERLDYVELDPEIISVFKTHFPDQWRWISGESKIQIYLTDGRAFLKQSDTSYDVIIVSMPDPSTMQLNRFYTREFFNETAGHLKPDGIFSFRVTGSENYINEASAKLLRCLFRTLKVEFAHVGMMPGTDIHFFASQVNPAVMPVADSLIQRIKQRNIQTQYVRDYFISFRLMPDRIASFWQEMERIEEEDINSDYKPVAYYFTLIIWGMQFFPGVGKIADFFSSSTYWYFFFSILVSGIILIMFSEKNTSSKRYAGGIACFAVGAIGFSVMTFEFILLLVFQSLYGYLYQQIALLMAAIMSGLALGSWLSLKMGFNRYRLKLVVLHVCMFILPVLFFMGITIGESRTYGSLIFIVMMLSVGFLGGYQFPLANYLYSKTENNPGIIYGFDLLGALLSALLVSILCIPVFGLFKTVLLILLVNVLVIIALIILNYKGKTFKDR
jgi:spermidine synthase